MIILNKEEIKNGWDELSLKKFLREMERDHAQMIYGQRKPKKQSAQNHRYRPLKWRR